MTGKWKLNVGWAWWVMFAVTHSVKAVAAATRGDSWYALIYGALVVGFAWLALTSYEDGAGE